MIGLLLWDIESASVSNYNGKLKQSDRRSQQAAVNQSRQPGSRLKTPNYPIWITSCTGHFGVIFNRNPDLLRNYHAESRFDVNYYSCSGHQILMTIDNRTYHDQALVMLERQPISPESTSLSAGGKQAKDEAVASVASTAGSGTGGASGAGNDGVAKEESTLNTPLQRLIHTKWEEATISFHVQPSMLSYLFSTTQ